VPYSLEEELKKRGAKYGKSSIPFKSHVVEDGLLITGQNPASAAAVGEAVVKTPKGRPAVRGRLPTPRPAGRTGTRRHTAP
jgi:putative intracellular protease/amidase